MININNNLIKELRKRTNISIARCKQILIDSNGDIELAVRKIKQLNLYTTLHRVNRVTSFGMIAIKVLPNKQFGIIVEVNCETDFVARNNVFQSFVEIVIMTAINEKIDNIHILNNKLEFQRLSLMEKIGENITIRRFSTFTGSVLGYYLHGIKIGVMVAVDNNISKNIIKYIAMHIAARNPKYISVADIPASVISHEQRLQMNIAIKSGKPKAILNQIVTGRIDKLIKEIVLVKQDFIMNLDKTVEELLNENGIKIENFIRYEIGENVS